MSIKKLYCVLLVFAFMICGTLAYSTSVSAAKIAEWKMDEESGNIVGDSSGQWKNGTVIGGATWVEGIMGNALNFAGSTQYVTAPPSVEGKANWTIEAWVKPVDGSGDYCVYSERNPEVNFYISITGDNSIKVGTYNCFREEGSEWDEYTTDAGVITRNAWNYVAVTLAGGTGAPDSGTVTCYANGKVAGASGLLGISKITGITEAEWVVGASAVLTRIGDTAGIATGKNVAGNFDDIYPWSEMKLCNVADNGDVNATIYDGDAFKRYGENGQVMVKIPKFYYKHTYEGGKHRFGVAAEPSPGYSLHPAFFRNGVEKNNVFVGAYEAGLSGGLLTSVSGVSPSSNITLGNFRTYANARGTGWSPIDIQTFSAIQILYLVECANMDSQATFGIGRVREDAFINTGGCDNLFGVSGTLGSAVSYRGIENLWGNVGSVLDGFVNDTTDSQVYVGDHNFALVDDYLATGIFLNKGNFNTDYYGNISCEPGYEWLFAPQNAFVSNINDMLCIYNKSATASKKVPMVGGYSDSYGPNDGVGLFAWDIRCMVTKSADENNGSRLIYVN
ncbi:MAG: hypothetical protein PHD60_09380 [Clostridia bacterium]|nr:hypothetical protein [Clostridia bacterium]